MYTMGVNTRVYNGKYNLCFHVPCSCKIFLWYHTCTLPHKKSLQLYKDIFVADRLIYSCKCSLAACLNTRIAI